jgi:glycosyltransferase involved in cell wall biosynthesis
MNVLSVNKFFWRKGGSEAVFFGEKELLESQGHTVWPFSMHSEGNLKSEFSSHFVEEVDYESPRLIDKVKNAVKIVYSFDARSKMEGFLRDYTPDVAQFHIFQHQISVSTFGPLRKRGIPILLTVHDLKPMCANYKMYVAGQVCEACKGGKYLNCFKKRCNDGSAGKSLINTVEMYFHHARGYYDWVDQYICVSRFYRQKMLEWGFPESKVSYLPNYIDANSIQYSTKDDRYILYFGRLSEEKAVDQVLDAARANKDIPCVIAGTGPAEDALKHKAKTEGIDNVQFVGFQTGEALQNLVANCTMTVISSAWYENCPMSVLESLAYGKPVVGARVAGIPELIEDGEDGLTFEAGNVSQFASAIRHFWDNPDLAAKAGLSGRSKIEQKFSKEAHYEGLMAIYNSAINAKPLARS